MIRFVLFVVAITIIAIAVWIESVSWLSTATGVWQPTAPKKSEPRRAIRDYERIRDNGIQAARMRLAHEAATFLERIGHLESDLGKSRADERRWLRGHLELLDGLPRFTKPDEVDLYQYWVRLHASKTRFAQALERFELERREIENGFYKALEGIDPSRGTTRSTTNSTGRAQEEAMIEAAQACVREWDRLGFDHFAGFQAACR